MRRSSGVLLHRRSAVEPGGVEVLLAHPGGPLWARRDVWGIPKGEPDEGEDLRVTAWREFAEEVGLPVPTGAVLPLGEVVQKGGKVVTAWAVEGDLDPAEARSNLFTMEWPPRSGRQQQFPEVDRVAWFTVEQAREKLLPAQLPFVERLLELLA